MCELILFGAAFWFGIQWVLGPLHRAGHNRKCPVQFALADLMCFFFLAALSMGGIHSLLHSFKRNRDLVPDGLVYYLDSLAIVAAGLAWWGAVRTLSRARIREQWQRLLVLVVAVPFAYLGPMAAIAFFMVGLECFPENRRLAAGLWLGGSAIASAVFLSGTLTRRCVASVHRQEHVNEPTDDQNAKHDEDTVADFRE